MFLNLDICKVGLESLANRLMESNTTPTTIARAENMFKYCSLGNTFKDWNVIVIRLRWAVYADC